MQSHNPTAKSQSLVLLKETKQSCCNNGSSGVTKQQTPNASTESKQPAVENKVFSWAATVAKTANVPVKPVSKLVSKNVDGEKKKKKVEGKKGDASAKQPGKQGAKTCPQLLQVESGEFVKTSWLSKAPQATGENGKVATNEVEIVTATKTTMPIPKAWMERPELTQERENFEGEGATRVHGRSSKSRCATKRQ